VEKIPVQVSGPREATGKKKLTVMPLDVQTFDGHPLEVRGIVLTGLTEDDIFWIAVARYFGDFKPSASVLCEADIYIPVPERIVIVKNDLLDFLNHKRRKLVIIRIPRCPAWDSSSWPCSGPRPRSGPSGSRLFIMGLQHTACLLGRPCERQRASLHNILTAHSGDVDQSGMQKGRGRRAWRAVEDI
jgi:hypothetical protein